MKRFVAALGSELSLTSEEIADILWLAVQMGELPQPATSELSQSLDTGKPRSPQQIDPPMPKDPIDLPNPESSPPPAEIYVPEGSNLGGGLTISVPDARSLREPLELARSLKPLLQRVASGWSNVLDEEATILKIDRDRVWLPVLKPNLEAWLDLVLVVDESVSMQIWQRTISELQRFLAHYGVFRDVRVYSLVVENERVYVRPRLGAASQGQSLRNPQELIDPSGRRLILVATDCVSGFWRSGEVLPALKLWAKSGPMAIVQMLPEWLWGRSGLGLASAVRFAALQAGIPNHQLKATNLSLWDDVDLDVGIKVPVVTLESAPMKTWAQLVAGKGGIQSPGFVFDPEPLASTGDEGSRTEGLFAGAGSGEERVRRFQVTASPMARQLAMILAAAPTISLPIVRILQDRLLPRSQQVHVAEVFLGGLLKPLVAVDPQSNPDLVPYEFMDGARDVLLDSVPTSEVVNVMQEVSQFVAERLGLTLDAFMGVLRNPQETADLDVVSQSRPFAMVTAQILRKLGGGYAQLAQELEQANRQDCVVVSNKLDLLEQILNEKLPTEQVNSLIERLTIASGDGAVAIAGDASGSVIITENRNVTGDNNHVIIHQGIDAEELVKMLRNLLNPQKISTQFQSLIADKTEGFVGREYVFDAIESFINNNTKGYFTIIGDPGMGKSAILAKYVQNNGCIAHFNVQLQGLNRTDQFLKSVCKQLIYRYQLPYNLLPANATQDGEFLGQLLDESAQKRNDQPVIIAVDALDGVDSTSYKNGNILYLPPYLPNGVYFILTRRRGVEVPLVTYTPKQTISLLDYQIQSNRDLRTYIQNRVNNSESLRLQIKTRNETIRELQKIRNPPALEIMFDSEGYGDRELPYVEESIFFWRSLTEFTNKISEKSQDNFRYAVYILLDIESGVYQDLTLERFPQSLQDFYHFHWQRMRFSGDQLVDTKIKIIYVLGEVNQPMSLQQICEFSEENSLTVQSVLNEWSQFLHESIKGENRYYSIYHSSFLDFLRSQNIMSQSPKIEIRMKSELDSQEIL
jgi:hypothetical protein